MRQLGSRQGAIMSDAGHSVTQGVCWHCFDSLEAYEAELAQNRATWEARSSWSETLQATEKTAGEYAGYCGVCQRPSTFTYSPDTDEVNVREALVCSNCQLNARQRAVWTWMQDTFPKNRRWALYLTEQATRFYQASKQHWPGVRGSEYFPLSASERLSTYIHHLLGQHEVLRWEDVCHLSLKNRSLHGLVCLEVLEHVPYYEAALAEFARVLKPNGQLIITVPFLDRTQETLVRARLTDQGEIEHLCPPEYHGDPVDGQGILAYYHFGWDLLDRLRELGFSKAQWCIPWAPAMGLFSRLWTLVAVR